ncbi:MAG: hypothetical protein KatS3mg019_2244 [Fimbriimonadales bacterium]|nr:MAG: hypothetical protein KatS3mg019_2244 [Fimbriimonadales bacterium]
MSNVTLKMLTEYLERFGWSRYQAVDEPFEKEGIIHTGWRSSEADEGYTLTIDPMVEKNCLSFRVPKILNAPLEENPEYLDDLTLAIGFINYRIILGKFAYDPRDGEVRFSVDVPIDENTFTYAQFVHTMGVVLKTTEEYAPKLRAIWNKQLTARDFIQQDIGVEMGRMRDAMAQMLRELLDALEREGETARRRPSDDDLHEV